jgi:hypothetical protein
MTNKQLGAAEMSDVTESRGAASAAGVKRCPWCGSPFKPERRRHGSAQRFCSTVHRHAFGTALRRWAVIELAAGRISIDALRAAQQSAYAPGNASGERVGTRREGGARSAQKTIDG